MKLIDVQVVPLKPHYTEFYLLFHLMPPATPSSLLTVLHLMSVPHPLPPYSTPFDARAIPSSFLTVLHLMPPCHTLFPPYSTPFDARATPSSLLTVLHLMPPCHTLLPPYSTLFDAPLPYPYNVFAMGIDVVVLLALQQHCIIIIINYRTLNH